jgi:hypothetical protein
MLEKEEFRKRKLKRLPFDPKQGPNLLFQNAQLNLFTSAH